VKESTSNGVRARLALVAAAALFSTGGAAIKASSWNAFQVASIRSLVAAAALLIAIPATRRGWTRRTFVAALAFGSTMVFFVLANKLTTSANAIFLQSTAPLYLVVLGPWLLREVNRLRDVVFMAVMAVGLGFFFAGAVPPASTAPHPFEGNLVALLSGISWALTVAGMRWLGTSGESHTAPIAAVVAGNMITCVICLPLALPAPALSAGDAAAVLYLGVFQIAAAYVCLTSGLRHIPALEASLLLLVEPVLNPLWAWLVHGERPGAWALWGGAIILAATAAKARRDG